MTWRVRHINHFYSNINGLLALLFDQIVRNLRQEQCFSTFVLSVKVNPFLKKIGQTSTLRKVCLSISRDYQGLSGYFFPGSLNNQSFIFLYILVKIKTGRNLREGENLIWQVERADRSCSFWGPWGILHSSDQNSWSSSRGP